MFLLGEPKRVRHSPFLRLLGVCIMEYVTCARILVARKLSYDSRHEYVRLYKDAHLRKYDVQIRAMRRGLLEYLPAALLPLWNELPKHTSHACARSSTLTLPSLLFSHVFFPCVIASRPARGPANASSARREGRPPVQGRIAWGTSITGLLPCAGPQADRAQAWSGAWHR